MGQVSGTKRFTCGTLFSVYQIRCILYKQLNIFIIPPLLSYHTHQMAPSNPSADMDNFRELLGSSKNIIALAGAGLSAASGIIFPSHQCEFPIDSLGRYPHIQRGWGNLETIRGHVSRNSSRLPEITFFGLAVLSLPSRKVCFSIVLWYIEIDFPYVLELFERNLITPIGHSPLSLCRLSGNKLHLIPLSLLLRRTSTG